MMINKKNEMGSKINQKGLIKREKVIEITVTKIKIKIPITRLLLFFVF